MSGTLKKENFPILVGEGNGGGSHNLPEHAFARENLIVLRHQLFPLHYGRGDCEHPVVHSVQFDTVQ